MRPNSWADILQNVSQDPGVGGANLRHLEDLIGNIWSSRQELLSSLQYPNSLDIDQECRYPVTESLTPEFYRSMYDREPIANRVVQLIPKECWQGTPTVYEDESADNITEFEEAWDNLGRNLSTDPSWYQDEKGSPIWEYLSRGDILSGIGQFGVILLGIDDGKNLQDPVDGVEVVVNGRAIPDSPAGELETNYRRDDIKNSRLAPIHNGKISSTNGGMQFNGPIMGSPFVQGTDSQHDSGLWSGMNMSPASGQALSGTDSQYFGVQFGPSQGFGKPSGNKRKLLFMRVFDESLVQIVRYEWNIRNPRFNLPVMYRVTLNDPRQGHTGVGLPNATVYVHWSRIIHLADNLHSSEILGIPRMLPVLNPLLDIRKVRSSSAEGYWKTCFSGLSLETTPQLGGDVRVNREDLRQQVTDYQNGLTRILTLMGMQAKTLSPAVTDPTPYIASYMEAIGIKLGCPLRILKGAERGELASSQDDSNWNERKRERNGSYTTPRVICPAVNRFIQIGILPVPGGYQNGNDENNRIGNQPISQVDGANKTGGFAGTNGGDSTAQPKKKSRTYEEEVRTGATIRNKFAGRSSTPRQLKIKDRNLWVVNNIIRNENGQAVGAVTPAGYSVLWPEVGSLSKQDRVTLGSTMTTALAAYVSGNCESILPPKDFFTRFLDMSEEEADEMIQDAADAHTAQDTMTMPPMDGGRPTAPQEGQEGYTDPNQQPPFGQPNMGPDGQPLDPHNPNPDDPNGELSNDPTAGQGTQATNPEQGNMGGSKQFAGPPKPKSSPFGQFKKPAKGPIPTVGMPKSGNPNLKSMYRGIGNKRTNLSPEQRIDLVANVLSSIIKNANPEGCNQYKSCASGDGGSVSSTIDVASKFKNLKKDPIGYAGYKKAWAATMKAEQASTKLGGHSAVIQDRSGTPLLDYHDDASTHHFHEAIAARDSGDTELAKKHFATSKLWNKATTLHEKVINKWLDHSDELTTHSKQVNNVNP